MNLNETIITLNLSPGYTIVESDDRIYLNSLGFTPLLILKVLGTMLGNVITDTLVF